MFSVTKRCRDISKPSQYISLKDFEVTRNKPNERLFLSYVNESLAGLAVDYLTRLYLGERPENAFSISVEGAQLSSYEDGFDHYAYANEQLNNINCKIPDTRTIISALNLVQYDVTARTGAPVTIPKNFGDFSSKLEERLLIADCQTIIKLVQRCIIFFTKNQSVMHTELTFEGGYTDLIDKGDGDIATTDTIWDIKSFQIKNLKDNERSRIQSKHALQVLVYYLLGIHSQHSFYKRIRYIGLYNPFSNTSYKLKVSDISDKVKYLVSNQVIGYKMKSLNYKEWKKVDGTDPNIYNEAVKLYGIDRTNFDPQEYPDGIHEISKADYLTYLDSIDFYRPEDKVPSFPHVEHFYFLKNDHFKMFLSESFNKDLCVLHGGHKYRLELKEKSYYYNALPKYGNQILKIFSKYWDILYNYGEFLKKVGFLGTVHGNIVDLDGFSHVYVNPIDLSIHGYSALSITDRTVYSSVEKLVKENFKDKYPLYIKTLTENPPTLALKNSANLKFLDSKKKSKYELINSIQDTKNIKTYHQGTKMYQSSNRLRMLQYTYNHRLIVVWDSFIFDSLTKKISSQTQ